MAVSDTLATPLTEGAQYDHIKSENINLLFEALEEIRNKFSVTMTGTYASQSFNQKPTTQEEIVTNAYIAKIKEYIQAIETSKYVPDTYSSLISIPSAETYIKVGEYYNNYIPILKEMYQNCLHNGSYQTSSGCSANWSFANKCYSVIEYGSPGLESYDYRNVCEKYAAASHSANYSPDHSSNCSYYCGGHNSDHGSWGSGGCPSNCSGFASGNYRWV